MGIYFVGNQRNRKKNSLNKHTHTVIVQNKMLECKILRKIEFQISFVFKTNDQT